MTLDQFIAAHSGKYLDWDGVYGAQCVDLIDFYLKEVLEIPVAYANAVDWYGRDSAYLDWTANKWGDLQQKPPKGAIIVWGRSVLAGTGVNGHIAIGVDPGNGLTFSSFDQNWKGGPCQVTKHNYDGVIGWGTKLKPLPPMYAFPLNPTGFGAWMAQRRDDQHTTDPFRLLGQYFKEAYPDRTDIQANGRPLGQWLTDLVGEAIKEIKP